MVRISWRLFAPDRPHSLIEATLLQLGIPPEQLKSGACAIPADTKHVTESYEIIARAVGWRSRRMPTAQTA